MTIDGTEGPLTVGVNLTWLVPGVVGGSEEYSVRLLEGVAELDPPDLRLRLYARAEFAERYPDLGGRFEFVLMPAAPSKGGRILREQTWLAGVSEADDLVHHMGGTIPLRRRNGQPTVVTVHDLQPIEFPGNFSLAKRVWLGRMIPLAVRRADLVVCPSRFTAERITARLGAPPSRLRVVPHGYRPDRSDRADEGTRPSGDLVARLGGTRFLLYPAIAYPHKRHRDLLPVLAGLPPELADLRLVLTGGPGPESAALAGEIKDRGLRDRVQVLGRVPETDLVWLYRQALATVFPSDYEGFGNPCLEAMSQDCVLIAADAAAIPEVVGSAGLLVPPGDVDGWIDAIVRVAGDPHLAYDLRRRGRRRAGEFTVSMASNRLLSVYRDLLGTRSPQPLRSRHPPP